MFIEIQNGCDPTIRPWGINEKNRSKESRVRVPFTAIKIIKKIR